MENEEYEQASAIYDKGIHNCEDKAELYFKSGLLNYEQFQYFDRVINDMKNAIEYDSSYNREANYYIACAYHLKKDYAQAYEFYEKALNSGSDRVEEIKEYMETCREAISEE